MSKRTNRYIMVLAICSFFIIACGISNKEIAQREKSAFIDGKEIYEDETFEKIVSNIGRLRAMMCGKFVQYSTRAATDGEEYGLWRVNENKDSVIQYTIPVGDPRKNGYWVYHHQIITSLPNDPIFKAFEKLEPIDRDSIISTYYAVPEDFNLKIEQLNRNAFNSIKLTQLKLEEEEGTTTYIRQNPLFFKGISSIIINSQNNSYVRYIYEMKPSGILMGMNYFRTAEGKEVFYTQKDKLVKLAMVK